MKTQMKLGLAIVHYFGLVVAVALMTVAVFGSVAALEGCKSLTPQEDLALVQTGTTILCTIEDVEISDPELDKLCQSILPKLTAEQRSVVEKRLNARQAKRRATSADGGAK